MRTARSTQVFKRTLTLDSEIVGNSRFAIRDSLHAFVIQKTFSTLMAIA
jgi:hypothetical protein